MRSTSNAPELPVTAAWRKSSRSQASNCVEVAPLGDGRVPVAIRDSKDPDGPVLVVERHHWDRFLAGTIRSGFRLG
jgi:Domain of unknown function (DUF397)